MLRAGGKKRLGHDVLWLVVCVFREERRIGAAGAVIINVKDPNARRSLMGRTCLI